MTVYSELGAALRRPREHPTFGRHVLATSCFDSCGFSCRVENAQMLKR